MDKLTNYSPLWCLFDNALITFDLSYTIGFSLTGSDSYCFSDENLTAISHNLMVVLQNLPSNTTLRMYAFHRDSYDDLIASHTTKLRQANRAHTYAHALAAELHQSLSGYYKQELFLTITTKPVLSQKRYDTDTLGRCAHTMQKQAMALHTKIYEQLTHACMSITTSWQALAGDIIPLSGTQLCNLCYRLANPHHQRYPNPKSYRTTATQTSLRKTILASSITSSLDHAYRNGHYERVLSMQRLPYHVCPGAILELQHSTVPHILVMTLEVYDSEKAHGLLKKSRAQHHEVKGLRAKFQGASRMHENPDYALEKQHHDSNDILDHLTSGDKLCRMSLQVWHSAPSLQACNKQTKELTIAAHRIGTMHLAPEELAHHHALLSLLPAHHQLLEQRDHSILASRLCDLMPVYASPPPKDDALMMLPTMTGALVGFHPFDTDLSAWNAIVAGGSGSGKSFLVRCMLSSWCLHDTGHTIIITRGNDYQRFCTLLGGHYQTITPDDETLALNPLPRKTDDCHISDLHVATLLGMMTEQSAMITRQTKTVLHNSLETFYASLPDTTQPTLAMWDEFCTTSQSLATDTLQPLRHQLHYWLHGPYGNALNRTPSSQQAPVTVYNLEGISDEDTLRVMLSLLSVLIDTHMKTAQTITIFDEVWSLLKNKTGAMVIESLYRTVRKRGSSIWTISQSISDFTSLPSQVKSSVLTNSPIKFILQHDSSDTKTVSHTFELNKREHDIVASLKSVPGYYSEYLLRYGTNHHAIRFSPTPLLYWMATSHPRDCVVEQAFKERYPQKDIHEIIASLAQHYPHGALTNTMEQSA